VDLRQFGLRLAHAARPQIENVILHRRIDSTQACALRLIDQAVTEEIDLPPTLMIALEQGHGAGRAGRRWLSPEGGLYMTWLAAGLDDRTLAVLPMIAAAAALDAVGRLGVEDAVIKWPNDIEANGRKLAGLLLHARHGETSWGAVGLGVNLEHAPMIDDGSGGRAVSIADLVGPARFEDRIEIVVRAMVENLTIGVRHPENLAERWRHGLRHRPGESMSVRLADGTEVRGSFVGVTDNGYLRLNVGGAERVIPSGDVVE
jgi:BirA family biotin operon repressor/biotin-[acetyl-CoA-carboxylase] ligase